MKFKMQGGTAQGSTNLCSSCRAAHRTRSAQSNAEVVRCANMRGRVVPEPVAECNQYEDASQPTITAMREIAWPIAADKKGKMIGFMSPDQFNRAVAEGKAVKVEGPLVLPDGEVDW